MPFSLAVRANVLSSRPHARWALRAPMKSAKDPEKFHATRAVRQPNSKILDPSDIAFDSFAYHRELGRCLSRLSHQHAAPAVLSGHHPESRQRPSGRPIGARRSMLPVSSSTRRGFGCSRGRYDGLENPDVARQLRGREPTGLLARDRRRASFEIHDNNRNAGQRSRLRAVRCFPSKSHHGRACPARHW